MVESTGAHDATLVGLSMGGGEVARYRSRHAGKSVAKAALISSVVPLMLKTNDNPEVTEQAAFNAMAQGMTEDRAKFFGGFFKDFFGVGMLSHPASDELLQSSRGGSTTDASALAQTTAASHTASNKDADPRPDVNRLQ